MAQTQTQLIIDYIKEFGSIIPAKMSGVIYKEQMLGSESTKRCRELRAKGILVSEREGKFEKFRLKPVINLEKWNQQFYPVKLKTLFD